MTWCSSKTHYILHTLTHSRTQTWCRKIILRTYTLCRLSHHPTESIEFEAWTLNVPGLNFICLDQLWQHSIALRSTRSIGTARASTTICVFAIEHDSSFEFDWILFQHIIFLHLLVLFVVSWPGVCGSVRHIQRNAIGRKSYFMRFVLCINVNMRQRLKIYFLWVFAFIWHTFVPTTAAAVFSS